LYVWLKIFILFKIKTMSSPVASNCQGSSTNFVTLPISKLVEMDPTTITKALAAVNQKSCYLTPTGECTQDGCVTTGSSSSQINCDCLTFFANLNAGVYTGLTCIMNQASASTTAIATSEQTINFSIVTPGDIKNANIENNQTANAKLTTMTLTNAENQDTLANLSGQSILAILDQAKNDKTIFTDPVSQILIKAFETYIANDPNALSNNVHQSIVSKVSSISTVNAESKEEINIMITNSSWKRLNAKLDQSACIQILAETLATSVVSNITKNVLSTVLEKTLADFPTICNPNYKPESNSPSKKTGMNKKLKMTIIIVGAMVGLFILIVIIAVATSK
jgi:hypothetical protein